MKDLSFYRGKHVFVTGHTGFKGSWLCRILLNAGAVVTGYAMEPPTEPNLFSLAEIKDHIVSVIGDIRDIEKLKTTFKKANPEIVLHFAAQPIVRNSYKEPRYTYETNVMGTVNILECIRTGNNVRSFLNVTTDKVYKNNEWYWGYREDEPLDGLDPYSNSKSCSELVTHSYKCSFFDNRDVAISTARAGNVIGGGDFSHDRIIPDCVRAVVTGDVIRVRNPDSIRPYQHVLEALFAYLMIAGRQYENLSLSDCYNVGPDDEDCVTTGELVRKFCSAGGEDAHFEIQQEKEAPHEANCLKLDCSKLKSVFDWKPCWHIDEAIKKICEWTRAWKYGNNVEREMDKEIETYMRSPNRTFCGL